MTNTLYTPKTPTNQALTARPCGIRIALPVLLPVLLVTLLILSACGGGSKGAVTTNPPATCATNPFGDDCMSEADATARDVIIKRCIMIGNAGRDDCKAAIAKNPCIETPFIATCSDPDSTFADYVVTAQMQRRDFCEISTNAANKLCVTSVANICTGDIFDTICPSSTLEERQDFCRMGDNLRGNPNCADIAAPICAENPLFEALCTPDVVRQRMYCRTGTNAMTDMNCVAVIAGICTDNAFDAICDANDTEGQAAFCGRGNNFETYASNCTAILDTYCATRAFLPACDSRIAARIQACSGSLSALTTAGGKPTDCGTYADGICGFGRVGGSNPFAPICEDEDVSDYSATINTVRNAFCLADVFHASCDTDYINQRVAACHLNGVVTNIDPRCGTIIADNCPSSGTRNPACHAVVTLAEASTTASITNYVEATTDELELGFTQSAPPANISDFSSGVIRLSDLAAVTSGGDADGVGFASFTDSNGSNREGRHRQQKFYAGVLDGDTLGAPISENLKNAKWPAKLAIYNEVNLLCLGDENRQGGNPNCATAPNDGRVVEPAEFILLVSFDGSNGTIRADGIPVIGDYRFAIDAGFNTSGNIYGNTRLSVVRMSAPGLFPITSLTESSDGTITGKIGQKGLLAAFVSDGVNNRLGEYAGGLVAYNSLNPTGDATAPVCTAAGTPFHARCANNDALRIMLCSTRHATAMADFAENCTSDSDVTDAICAGSGTYANPFDSVICADPQPLVQQAFFTNCRSTDMSLRAGADCDAVLACTENPFLTTCNTAVTAEVYASARVAHLEYCNNAPVVNSSGCELALQNCASSSPHANCGDLTTTYCIGAAGRTITGDTTTCGARVIARCVTNPLSPLCANGSINTGFTTAGALKTRRETFCKEGINANNPDCAATIVGFCGSAPNDNSDNGIFNALCDNIVPFIKTAAANLCHNSVREENLATLCDNPHAYDIRRLEHCATVDFKLAGCGVTISEERQAMLEIICGDDNGLRGTNRNDPICVDYEPSHPANLELCGSHNRDGSKPTSPICEIEPQALVTVAALCGQGFEDGSIGNIGINPFSAVCASDLVNSAPCPSCTDMERTDANTNAWTEAQRNFCRQDITNNACTKTIADFCPNMPDDKLFDTLCDGNDYLADRVTHCETAFTHAKCAENQMNISDAAAICGTTSVPGTNPFNTVCESETLNPIACPSCEAISDMDDKATELARIRAIVLTATQQTFCRADITNGDCASTIRAVCNASRTSAVIFDDMLCAGDSYDDERLAYCINPLSTHHDCGTDADNKAALTTLCTDNDDGVTFATNPLSIACDQSLFLRNLVFPACPAETTQGEDPRCTNLPAISALELTETQQGFCRRDITNTACTDTIADFCDFSFEEDILDPLCGGGETYQDMRLTTCLTDGIDNENCRGAAGIVATLCPTDGDGTNRHELCPLIVNHALYTSRVNDFNESAGEGFVRPLGFNFLNPALSALGVIDKTKVHTLDYIRNDDYDVPDDVERAIGYATDAPATLIRGTSTGLEFGILPSTLTTIRQGGAQVDVRVRVDAVSTNGSTSHNAYDGYALAVAAVTTQEAGRFTTENKLYAGLLSGTKSDVGAPNFDNPSIGIWNASMNLIMNGGSARATDATFDLIVDFNTQTIKTHATRFAQFTLTGADFDEPQFTPTNSRLVELRNPLTGTTYYQRDRKRRDTFLDTDDIYQDIIVASGDTYTDCDGNLLVPGNRVPLCKGGGSPDYTTLYNNVLVLDSRGDPMINTKSKKTTGRLTIDAQFSTGGLVYGAVNLETGFLNFGNFIGKRGEETVNSAGRLVGWIGNDKLVGAFASNAGSAEAYAGGFTATPSATLSATLSPTRFITGGTDKLTLTGSDAADATPQLPHPLGITSNEDYVIDGTTNGFALASENIADGEVRLYAGILSGTDLGNPLFDNSATGTWNAKLNLLMFGDTVTADFALKVDFNTRSIETLADSPAEFAFADIEYEVIQRSAEGSPVTALIWGANAPVYLKDIDTSIDARVGAAQVITTDCAGVALNLNDPIPVCEKNAQGAPILVQSNNPRTDCDGNALAVGDKIPLCNNGPVYEKNNDQENILVTAEGVGIKNCVTGAALNVGDRIPLCEGDGRPIYVKNAQGYAIRKNGIPLIETTTATASTTGRLTVKGRFSSTGKIRGTTNIQIGEAGSPTELAGGAGTLTGLIGEAGLVAAFISDPDGRNVYAGGFTATPWVCTAGGTPFSKTNCPDTNIGAKALRLQLCLDRDPAATADFATNCAGDTAITTLVCTDSGAYANPFDAEICPTADDNVKTDFVNNNCLADSGQADACATGQVARCLHDPYAFVCKSDIYEDARTAHLDTCGIATAPPNPRCVNLRLQLNSCAVAQPDPSCGTLVTDYCLGGAGRAITGKSACAENIRTACTTNAFNPRCLDAGVFATQQDRTNHITKLRDFCTGDLNNLPSGATPLDCNTLGITLEICGSPTAFGTNPFATICSNPIGNPYSEARQLKLIQTVFCEQDLKDANRDCNTIRQDLETEFEQLQGKTEYWANNAIREVAVPVLNEDGSIKTKNNPVRRGDDPVTKLVQLPIKITPANMVRQDNPLVNYIIGGTTALELGGAPLTPKLNSDGTRTIDTTVINTPTSIDNADGLTLSDIDSTKDDGSGFAFASATFPTRTYQTHRLDVRVHTVGGTKLYTGLLADTNVGAPLSDIQTEVEWSGQIDAIYGNGDGSHVDSSYNETISNYDPQDFTLLVSFYGSFGIIKPKMPIKLDDDTTFTIDGRFTDRGLIYGKTSILNGQNITDATGSLTGLIGAKGAVATFISDDRNPRHQFGNYAGGFVALPPAGTLPARMDFADWLGSFQAPNTPLTRAFNAEEFASANNKPHFIHGNLSGLTASNDTDYIRPVNNLTLDSAFNDGNIYDGVSYLRGTGNRRYAGLLLGTDLGAPVTGTTGTSAQWAGVFRDVRFSYTLPRSFTLTVRFTAEGGTLDALLSPAYSNNRDSINAIFDTSGIISGQVIGGNYVGGGSCETNGLPTIESGCFTDDGSLRFAKLSGIIGEQGAVAAFITDDSTNTTQPWAGGFVATPDFCGNTADTTNDPQCNTNRADWVGSFGGTAPPATKAASTAGTGVFGGFLDLSGGAIAAGVLKTAPNGASPATSSGLNRTPSGPDGFVFIAGYNGDNHQVFVGILPNTNLARPLIKQPAIAAWPGTYYDSIATGDTAVTFNIDFTNRSIGTSIADSVTNPPTFDLGFNNAGVITGTVTKNNLEATARGLIGQQGLIGAFVDTGATSGNVFHGGFVATNPGHSN